MVDYEKIISKLLLAASDTDSVIGYDMCIGAHSNTLQVSLNVNKLLEGQEMPVYYFEEDRNKKVEKDRSDDFEIKSFIKTVHINKSKRTVTVVLKNGSIGISRCHDTDTFDAYIGFCVALTYALFPSRTATIKYVDECIDKNNAKATARAEAHAKKVAKRSAQSTTSER